MLIGVFSNVNDSCGEVGRIGDCGCKGNRNCRSGEFGCVTGVGNERVSV